MTATRNGLGRGAALVGALVLALGLLAPGVASAENPPAVLYGQGLTPGQTVSAWIGGKLCASTVVDGGGEWAMQILDTNACGPTGGAAIAFQLDGKDATASPAATFALGGIPGDIAHGYKLTLSQATPTATVTATATATATTPAATATATTPASTATAAATVVPLPPKTGSAGLLDDSNGRGGLWLILAFAVVAASGVAARTAYARRSS